MSSCIYKFLVLFIANLIPIYIKSIYTDIMHRYLINSNLQTYFSIATVIPMLQPSLASHGKFTLRYKYHPIYFWRYAPDIVDITDKYKTKDKKQEARSKNYLLYLTSCLLPLVSCILHHLIDFAHLKPSILCLFVGVAILRFEHRED